MHEIDLQELLAEKNVRLPEYLPSFIRSFLLRVLERLLFLPRINRFLRAHGAVRGVDLVDEIFDEVEFSFLLGLRERERIPAEGPLIVIANHPLGGLDGLALLKIVKEVRPDVRIVANDVLMSLGNLSSIFLPIDTFSKRSMMRSMRGIDEALEKNEAVIIFPAGEVSRMTLGGVLDSAWQGGAIFLAKRHQAPVLPVFIDGRNSLLFYFVSLLSKSFSTLLLPLEMFRPRRAPVSFHIGKSIPARAFAALDVKVATRLLRHQTYVLKHGGRGPFETEQHIIPPVQRQQLLRQLMCGFDMGSPAPGKRLFVVTMDTAPLVVREIARLRELTFRRIGEGTGKKMDADCYDEIYQHLVLWDERALEIAGAYRIGVCREIVRQRGEAGLYTHSLFSFQPSMRRMLPTAMELGRSFLQPIYQNSYALEYLWAGIGAIWHQNKNIQYLFGPVSITNALSPTAKDALVYFYTKWFGAQPPFALSFTPYVIGPEARRELAEYFVGLTYKEDFNRLKLRLRTHGASVPTLLRQYTELTGTDGVSFSDFGVDKGFGDCIDGFVVVDIRALTASKRERFIDRYASVLKAPTLGATDVPAEAERLEPISL